MTVRRSSWSGSRRSRRAGLALLCSLWLVAPAWAVVLDSSKEDFEARTLDATIHGAEFWTVTAGSTSSAMVQSSVTPGGTGKALKLTSAASPVAAARSTTYGGVTPTWVRMLNRPGLGGEQRSAPTSGVAAVSFDFSGRILAADGTSWVDTGQAFTGATWWEVIYKLNFTTHTYDLYLSQVGAPTLSFTPVKTGLKFVDSAKSSLGTLQFLGAYSAVQSGDTYVDDVTVTYIERVEFVSAAQTLVQDQPSGPITVQLQNSLREPQRAVADVYLELKSTSSGGRFSLQQAPWSDVSQVLLPKDSTSVTVYYKDSTVGKPTLSVNEFPDQGWLEGLQQQKVVSQLAHFEVLATSPQTAGTPFAVTIYARAEDGSVEETYGGTVLVTATYVNPATGTMLLTPSEASGFSKGRLDLSLTYPDAGVILVTVTDKGNLSKTGTSGQVSVLPARFQVEAGARQIVGRPWPLSVTALNAAGAVTPNYRSAVTLGIRAVTPTTGAGTLTPAAVGATDFQAGKATVNVTYPRWGTVTVTATDAAWPTVVGQSAQSIFHPEAILLKATTPPPPRDFFYTGEAFTVSVTPLAAGGAVIPNYEGTVTVSAPPKLGLPENYTFTAADAGVHHFSVSVDAAGSYQVQAAEPAAELTSASLSLTIKQATLKVIDAVAPVGGAATVEILLLDETGQVITSESAVTLKVKLVEANPNESVSSPALTQTITVTQGKATLLIANTEEETVTIIPSSTFGMQVQQGTVSFGRLATKGIGVLLWREVTEEPAL